MTPMFERITSRSFGDTIRRINASTFATSDSVTEMRLPVGALTLMTNMPASVRGKKDKPISGYRARLATKDAPQATTVSHGRRSARATIASYKPRNDSKRSLNHTLKRSPIRQRFFLLLSSTSTGSSEAGVP